MATGMQDRLEFQQRLTGVDGFGGQSETWTAQFVRAAAVQHIGGGEQVEAMRLAGRELYRLTLRSDSELRAVTTDGWRIRDTRRNVYFNILSVDAITDRARVHMRVEGFEPAVAVVVGGVGASPSGAFEDLPPLP